MCHINGDDTPRKLSRIEVDELDGILLDFWTNREDYLSIQVYLSEVKPYLRPMSSMTEEEKESYLQNIIGTLKEMIFQLGIIVKDIGMMILSVQQMNI